MCARHVEGWAVGVSGRRCKHDCHMDSVFGMEFGEDGVSFLDILV